ncbi:gliding motility-associated C-terminal domain-containing protein [Mucilaginibacter flavidus]|uniref:gliding motility-associated C-terminal domain-containing protein n=1 Tax=Mucilaginibacter flavidus TaxID=2949309 RepID=UPI002093813C|nr:gliding motility-associated C-terminal domain-containing protein [Mucilaginibacter flavidus]MCO5948557.1 gliding motility-associated C-terminal domain-containing protein [Mucilaginibacter flavidus]
MMTPYRYLLTVLLVLACTIAYGQQDLDFTITANLLTGKKVLKVRRDFSDPYAWVLTSNNGVYRVNSITLTIDDYTAKFSAYSNLRFIDIAGLNQDDVFIAANSTNVIEYKNGALKKIGSSDGMVGAVNSIGVSNFDAVTGRGKLLIGTATGRGVFDPATGQLNYFSNPNITDIKIFESTYRTQVYKENTYDPPDPQQYPIIISGYQNAQEAYIYQVNESGPNVTTVYVTLQAVTAIPGYGSDIFWGNEKGMFQEAVQNFYNPNPPYGHYLDNTGVNKITAIYGLTSLGNPNYANPPFTLTKENLLIGTAKGLYFSNSMYGNYDGSSLRTFSLFHFDQLGNVAVNDVCVSGTASNYLDTPAGCEGGIWLASDNGLYLIKPDYGKYFDPKQMLKAASFNIPNGDNLAETTICGGSSVDLVLNQYDVQNNGIQWYKNGNILPGANLATLSVKTAGDYYALIYASCENIHAETNHLKVSVTQVPVFSFNYPDKIQNCNDDPVTLKTDDKPGYSYRWYTNGVLNGETSPAFTVTQTGKYKVEVSACTDSWVPSKEIEVDLVHLPVPVINADKAKYCTGENAILTVNAATEPDYEINWFSDGNKLTADKNKTSITTTINGKYTVTISSKIAACTATSNQQQITFTPAPVFTFNYPDALRYCDGTPLTLKAEGSTAYQYRWYKDDALTGDLTPSLAITRAGKYKIEVSSCDGSWVPSKEVSVDFVSLPAPVIIPDKPSYCIGDNATLSIPVPADPAYTIKWFKDNVLLPAANNTTSLPASIAGDYTVSIVSNHPNSDGTTCSQTSAAQSISFNPPPTISIQKIIKTTLCDGQTVDLKVSYNNGTVKWSTGDTNDQITVSSPGTYKATVTSSAGCPSDASVDVLFFSNPVLNIANAELCEASHKTVTLTAPAGLQTYVWNGQPGGETFIAYHAQTVTLTVTDVNGCQATQEILVTDDCPDVKVPNTFTPNNDGVNDTWEISGLAYDPTAVVKVFTRYGQEIYESKGYGKPWNGEYRGKKLAAGVYYYIITIKNGKQTFSGPVTIIY